MPLSSATFCNLVCCSACAAPFISQKPLRCGSTGRSSAISDSSWLVILGILNLIGTTGIKAYLMRRTLASLPLLAILERATRLRTILDLDSSREEHTPETWGSLDAPVLVLCSVISALQIATPTMRRRGPRKRSVRERQASACI